MNRNLAAGLSLACVAAAATAAAAMLIMPRNAFAQGEATGEPSPFVGAKTRDEVRAELATGTAWLRRDAQWGEQPTPDMPLKSTLTRREARDAYTGDREQTQALVGEDSGSRWLSQPARNPTTVMGAPHTDMIHPD